MRWFDSVRDMQLRTSDEGQTIVVTSETHPNRTLAVLFHDGKQSADEFGRWCTAWSASLRDDQWTRMGHQMGRYNPAATDFDSVTCGRLNAVARLTGREDVFLYSGDEGGYVFGPWTRRLIHARSYLAPTEERANEYVRLLYREVTDDEWGARRHRPLWPRELPEGTEWVARRSAEQRSVTFGRVVDLDLIAGGGQVVTWVDDEGNYHITEDYHNIDLMRV